ncbi:hypothetical protein FA15DRAFT_659904 [Coprinopsis marcescibilis]|uniref:Uncharacterized protein n=1 Tax=Coprinopsis marcescibilis TaxID=230819 RepID=A0A5C3KH24_COPMA|nr:hypothetical protein FA15DRAFT_659904 [Coprinopsis marcescibilis]
MTLLKTRCVGNQLPTVAFELEPPWSSQHGCVERPQPLSARAHPAHWLLFSRVELKYPAQTGKHTAAAELLSVINDSPRLFAYITTVVLTSTLDMLPPGERYQDLGGDKALVDVLNKLAILRRIKAFTLWEKVFCVWDFVSREVMDALVCNLWLCVVVLIENQRRSHVSLNLLLAQRKDPGTGVNARKRTPYPKIHNLSGLDLSALNGIEMTSTGSGGSNFAPPHLKRSSWNCTNLTERATFFIRSPKPSHDSSEGDWGLFSMSQVIDSIPASSPLKLWRLNLYITTISPTKSPTNGEKQHLVPEAEYLDTSKPQETLPKLVKRKMLIPGLHNASSNVLKKLVPLKINHDQGDPSFSAM